MPRSSRASSTVVISCVLSDLVFVPLGVLPDTDPNAVLLADVTEGPEEQRSFGLQSAGSTAVQAAFKDESADTAREPELAATHSVCSHMATYASPHHQSTAEKI